MDDDSAGFEATQIMTGDFDVGMETGPGLIDVALVNASTRSVGDLLPGRWWNQVSHPSRSYSMPLDQPGEMGRRRGHQP